MHIEPAIDRTHSLHLIRKFRPIHRSTFDVTPEFIAFGSRKLVMARLQRLLVGLKQRFERVFLRLRERENGTEQKDQ